MGVSQELYAGEYSPRLIIFRTATVQLPALSPSSTEFAIVMDFNAG